MCCKVRPEFAKLPFRNGPIGSIPILSAILNNMYLDIINIVTLISIVSIATERVVEISKPLLPTFNKKYNTTIYSLLALGVSCSILVINEFALLPMFGALLIQNLVLALACTAGSGFWNDLLKILQGFKINAR